MTRNWTELEAVSLDGRYWLKVCLTSSANDAWFLTRFDTDRDAAVRVMAGDSPTADRQLEMWRRAIDLEHPHLVRMLDAGRTENDGAPLIYAVCEYPDDFLAAALAERPLSPSEARQVLESVRQALGYLHAKHLVHCAVDVGHIMAFGDTIKLPSDTIQPAGPEHATADDMLALGRLLHHVLTREQPREDAETDYSFLPRPFGAIVNHTLERNPEKRWTVRDIENHLNPPPPKVEPMAAPVVAMEAPKAVEKPAVEKVPAGADERTQRRRPEGEGEREARPVVALPPPHRRTEAPADRGIPLKWVPVAGLAAAVALGAVFLRHPNDPAEAPAAKERPAVTSPKAAPVAAPPAAAPPATAPVERKPSPVAPSKKQSRDRIESAAVQPSTGAPIWRVVAFTYNRREQAENKAKALNEKRSGWRAEVFAPKGERAPYFVSLGGRMTLSEAERMQKEARAKGLPRDTFVRNFSN
jgi:hypothetical protein